MLPGSTQDIKAQMNPALTPRGASPDGSLIGAPSGPNEGGSNLTLKGWPLIKFSSWEGWPVKPVGDVIPNVGSPIQTAFPVLPHADTDMLIKVWLLILRNSSSCFENTGTWFLFSSASCMRKGDITFFGLYDGVPLLLTSELDNLQAFFMSSSLVIYEY
ncbi:uncharacterized protein LOC103705480 isoform X2 [Phoenix dactylifera]|uniref:Uncharacterized protein LOC103705480 isoform X2 n=1 Tax=Phoenix dactylifera TaxID=42345 RepID=A0A8B8J332_PHODC|nr:uncharacterized protein LOC103705480 isoform X2 [Phoenix dactylifera]